MSAAAVAGTLNAPDWLHIEQDQVNRISGVCTVMSMLLISAGVGGRPQRNWWMTDTTLSSAGMQVFFAPVEVSGLVPVRPVTLSGRTSRPFERPTS